MNKSITIDLQKKTSKNNNNNNNVTRKELLNRIKNARTYTETIESLEDILKHKKTQKNIPIQSESYDDIQILPCEKEPNYGCIKQGIKPTYKELNKTPRSSISFKPDIENSITIDKIDTKLHESEKRDYDNRQNRLNVIKSQRKRHTYGKQKTRKNNVIKLCLPNRKTLKQELNEINNIETMPYSQVKKYLRKHLLINKKSSAPEFIHRQTMKCAKLTGTVINKNIQPQLKNDDHDILLNSTY